MTAKPFEKTVEYAIHRLEERVARLRRFYEIKAPQEVIDNEIGLITDAIGLVKAALEDTQPRRLLKAIFGEEE